MTAFLPVSDIPEIRSLLGIAKMTKPPNLGCLLVPLARLESGHPFMTPIESLEHGRL